MIWLVSGTILLTSFISGIFGMAGGLILIGVLSLLLPVASAMILHAITQIGSNGFRAYLHRRHIHFQVLPGYLLGSLAGFAVFSALQFVPSKSFVLIAAGLFPFLALLLPKSATVDISQRGTSLACGVVITATQILAGASGPLLDLFFLNSPLNRHQIIATKAITQTIGHLFKLAYYGRILYESRNEPTDFYYLIPIAVISALIGTRMGKTVLDRISDLQFQKYSRIVIVLIGFFYILKGLTI